MLSGKSVVQAVLQRYQGNHWIFMYKLVLKQRLHKFLAEFRGQKKKEETAVTETNGNVSDMVFYCKY